MPESSELQNMLQEDPVVYLSTPVSFPTTSFQQLSDLLGFSQAEWAEILHFSPRTLQRYLKDSNAFEGLQAELLHQVKRLTDAGLTIFNDVEGFAKWLRADKEVLGNTLGFDALKTITGVKMLRQELGRMAEGIYI